MKTLCYCVRVILLQLLQQANQQLFGLTSLQNQSSPLKTHTHCICRFVSGMYYTVNYICFSDIQYYVLCVASKIVQSIWRVDEKTSSRWLKIARH